MRIEADTIFNVGLAGVPSHRPAVERILVERRINGALIITCSHGQDAGMKLLDEAMEAIDGQRVPND
jgi:hypothetical protein